MPAAPPTLYSIGHSTRPIEEFVALLRMHGVRQLVDVRTAPGSRRNPQYGADALAASLAEAGIAYSQLKPLGGRRRPRADSPNAGWRNLSFRGYADHMQTPEFAAALAQLIALGRAAPTAFMCAEAVPWRCHRSLIGDALIARGLAVVDIVGERDARPHKLNPMAVVRDGGLIYPPEEAAQLELVPAPRRTRRAAPEPASEPPRRTRRAS